MGETKVERFIINLIGLRPRLGEGLIDSHLIKRLILVSFISASN